MMEGINNETPNLESCENGNNTDAKSVESLSKRAMKKLAKRQMWLERKPIKRAEEREKRRKRRIEARLNQIDLGLSRKRLKKAKMSTSPCKVNVVIDFSFNDLMSEKCMSSAVKQLGFCYGSNRRVPHPVQFYVTSFGGSAKSEMEKNEGYDNWDVNFKTEDFINLFDKDKIIYLTSDSDNVIDKLENGNAYIIGGIVDHNFHKRLCLQKAIDLGLNHARLPISEYIKMKSRKVLAINHVFEILVNVCNGKTWREAFLQVIPGRKGALDKEAEVENLSDDTSTKDFYDEKEEESPPAEESFEGS